MSKNEKQTLSATANGAKSAENNFDSKRKSDVRFWFRLISLCVIVPIYTFLVIYFVALPRSTVSYIENRNLATFPEFTWESYWSGDFAADVGDYFVDTVPNRDTLKQAASNLLNLLGVKYNDVQITGNMSVVNDTSSDTDSDTQAASDTASQSNDASANTDTSTDSEVDNSKDYGQEIADGVYTNGVIVVYQDGHYRAMSMYGGGSGETYAAAVNATAESLPDVNVYSMIAPTASEYYTPSNFSQYNASQSDDIDAITELLDSSVTSLNICSVLEKHTTENIYTRTDHHWMSLGAYYAAQAFASAAGVSFDDLSAYNEVTVEGYVGTMYSFSDNNADLLNDPEDFVYYEPSGTYYTDYYDQSFNFEYSGDLLVSIGDTSSMYLTYMGGDGYIVDVQTDVTNGRKLLVIKDSYGNAEIPFYTGSFEEIFVIDMRYAEINLINFVEDMGITDILFTMCSYSAVGTTADFLAGLLTQNSNVHYSHAGAEESVVSETIVEEESVYTEESSEEADSYSEDENGTYEDDGGEDYTYEDDTYQEDTYYEEEY